MPFTTLQKKTFGPNAPLEGVTMSILKGQVRMRFGKGVAAESGLDTARYVSVAIGTGEDAGTIAISPARQGFALQRQHKSSAPGCSFRANALLPPAAKRKLPSTHCNHIIKNAVLIVEIPARKEEE